MRNLVKPRQIVRGASLRTPKWHNIAKRNDMLLSLYPRLITKLIHMTERWLAWNFLYMAKLPQHFLRTIRPHINLASDEAKENGLLCERPYGHHTTTSICRSFSLYMVGKASPVPRNAFHLVAIGSSTT